MDRVHILLASPLDNPVDCLAAVQLLLGDRIVGNAPNVAAEAIAGPGAEGGDSEFRYAVVRSGLSGLLPLDVLLDVQAGGDNPTVGDHCRAVRIDLVLNTSPSSSASSSCRAEDIRFALVVAAPHDWVECDIGESCRGTLPSLRLAVAGDCDRLYGCLCNVLNRTLSVVQFGTARPLATLIFIPPHTR